MTTKKKLLIVGLSLTIITLLTMGLFNLKKKSPEQTKASTAPYKDTATNLIYNLLFCDNLDLLKANSREPNPYPWDILFSETSTDKDF